MSTERLLNKYDLVLIGILTVLLLGMLGWLMMSGEDKTVVTPRIGQMCPDARARHRHPGNLDWHDIDDCRPVHLKDTVFTPAGQKVRVLFDNNQAIELEANSMVQFDWIDHDSVEINLFFGQARTKGKVAVRGKGTSTEFTGKEEILPAAAKTGFPFEVGEHLEYDLQLRSVTVATAVAEVHDAGNFSGRPALHFSGNVRSGFLASRIYEVNDGGEAIIAREPQSRGLQPLFARIVRNESKYNGVSEARFDPKLRQATQTIQVSDRNPAGLTKPQIVPMLPDTVDPLSAFYQVRMFDYQLNRNQNFPVYFNRQLYEAEITPVGVETVKTDAGTFLCWKMMARGKKDGSYLPRGTAYFWLTNDPKRYLVKFEYQTPKGLSRAILRVLRERD